MQRATLEVNDCVLRAPFDGEVADARRRSGRVRAPGHAVATVVDRTHGARRSADVPEADFDVVAPATPVRVHALATEPRAARARSRGARPPPIASTRTVHFEIDVPDPDRALPVGTTAELAHRRRRSPRPRPRSRCVAAVGARRQGDASSSSTASVAHKARLRRAWASAAAASSSTRRCAPGSRVVTEGRALLNDGDRVEAKLERSTPPPDAERSADGDAP